MLAEQPLADVASLLSLFQHVPPVVRRRAKELFDSIREASTRGAEDSGMPIVDAGDAAQAPMQVDEPAAEAARNTTAEETSLWSTSGTSY
jgi:exosome complex exonuclease RRP6